VLNWVKNTDSFTRIGLVKAIFYRMTLDELKRARCSLKEVISCKDEKPRAAAVQDNRTEKIKKHKRKEVKEEKKLGNDVN